MTRFFLRTYAFPDEVEAAAGAAEADGWACLNFPIENIEQAALLLLGIGPEIEVIEPGALRVRLGELAQQIAERARS